MTTSADLLPQRSTTSTTNIPPSLLETRSESFHCNFARQSPPDLDYFRLHRGYSSPYSCPDIRSSHNTSAWNTRPTSQIRIGTKSQPLSPLTRTGPTSTPSQTTIDTWLQDVKDSMLTIPDSKTELDDCSQRQGLKRKRSLSLNVQADELVDSGIPLKRSLLNAHTAAMSGHGACTLAL